MKKTELLNQYSADPEERVVLARALDQMERAEKRSLAGTTQFLSPSHRASLEILLDHCGHPRHLFSGGYEEAERTVCVFLPDWQEAEEWEPSESLAAVRADYSPTAELTHRDLLGGLMGTGLVREKIGDILVREGSAQIVTLRETLPILLSQFVRAGRYPLTVQEIPLTELTPLPGKKVLIRDTVPSLRLDAVLSAGFSLARGKASALISAGRVSVNHRECTRGDRLLAEGDILTCRGLGRCALKTIGGTSRKGRIIIELERNL